MPPLRAWYRVVMAETINISSLRDFTAVTLHLEQALVVRG
jgi:hypothetical protein